MAGAENAFTLDLQAFLDGGILSTFYSGGSRLLGRVWGQNPSGPCSLSTKAVLMREEHSPGAGFMELEMRPIS